MRAAFAVLVVAVLGVAGCADCEDRDPEVQLSFWRSDVTYFWGEIRQGCRVEAIDTSNAFVTNLRFACEGSAGTETIEFGLHVQPALRFAFDVGQEVSIRYRDEQGWYGDHFLAVHDVAGAVLLAMADGVNLEPFRDWFAPLRLSTADAGCWSYDGGQCADVERLALAATLPDASATVVDGRAADFGGPPGYRFVVYEARTYDQFGSCTDVPPSRYAFALARLPAE
jgi:hypothetical protein